MMDDFLNQSLRWVILMFLVSAMFSLGLDLTIRQVIVSLKDRSLIIKSLLTNTALVPLAAIIITYFIPMDSALKTGIILYSLAAGTEAGPKFVQIVRGNAAFAFGLLALLLTLTVICLPIVLALVIPDVHIPRGALVVKLLLVVALPVGIGLLLHARFNQIAMRLNPVMHRVSMILMWLLFAQLIYLNYREIVSLEFSALLAGLLLFTFAFSAGWVAGGPSKENRRALSIMTFARNGSIAMMIAAQVFAEDPDVLVMVTVMTALSLILAVLIVVWQRHLSPQAQGNQIHSL
jgi:BASS family bile acid:Na+ symporter